jgi:protein-L-isoaspartate(D-aspartate) O-methyltransferase
MQSETDMAAVRRAYAKQTLGRVGAVDARLEDAFAEIPREDFLGAGPWKRFDFRRSYLPTPDDDPVHVYTDDLFAIVAEKQLNNGQPSLHAALIARAAPQAGEHIVHIGAGAGYYTAIMAHMVGPDGHVTAIEYDPEVALLARANLAAYPNVKVVEGDGARVAFDPANVIYVNAGATAPAPSWLDGLTDGGRMILPLTTDGGFGASVDYEKMHRQGGIFRIERRGSDYFAKWIAPVAIFPCAGNRDEESERNLAAAFSRGEMKKITRLYRRDDIPDERCWVRGRGWCVAFE